MSTQNIRNGGRLAFVIDQIQISFGYLLDAGVHQLRNTAVAAVIEFARVVTCISQQLVDVLSLNCGASDQNIDVPTNK